MEALELYREETAKIKEHEALCKASDKEVRDTSVTSLSTPRLRDSTIITWDGGTYLNLRLP